MVKLVDRQVSYKTLFPSDFSQPLSLALSLSLSLSLIMAKPINLLHLRVAYQKSMTPVYSSHHAIQWLTSISSLFLSSLQKSSTFLSFIAYMFQQLTKTT